MTSSVAATNVLHTAVVSADRHVSATGIAVVSVPTTMPPIAVARGWLIEMPDVISHSHAVQSRIVVPKPVSVNHPPGPVRDDLSRTDTLVSELSVVQRATLHFCLIENGRFGGDLALAARRPVHSRYTNP